MKITELVQRRAGWMEAGSDSGPVISSRVRLARNLEGRRFPDWADEQEREAVWREMSELFDEFDDPSFLRFGMEECSPLEKELLFERHLISRELASRERSAGVFVSPDESLAVMINEEDLIRIQSLRPGFRLEEAWRAANELDDRLESRLPYAFSPKLGYLTACPSNVGTGMRASVMLHLPGLVLMEEMEPVINGVQRIGLAVRGLWGEGSEAAGNMYQVSNQITLGRSEEEIIARISGIVEEIVRHENNARARLLEERRLMVEDLVSRAFGILSHARLMTSAEALNLLSNLRLGVDLGLVDRISRRDLDRLFIAVQPAHLQQARRRMLDPEERDAVRAAVLREFIGNAMQGT